MALQAARLRLDDARRRRAALTRRRNIRHTGVSFPDRTTALIDEERKAAVRSGRRRGDAFRDDRLPARRHVPAAGRPAKTRSRSLFVEGDKPSKPELGISARMRNLQGRHLQDHRRHAGVHDTPLAKRLHRRPDRSTSAAASDFYDRRFARRILSHCVTTATTIRSACRKFRCTSTRCSAASTSTAA